MFKDKQHMEPSKALQHRATSARALIQFLMFLLFTHSPQAYSADLTVDTGAPAGQQSTLDRAANNVPIQNIARPNSKGLSHNKFVDYNVGSKGLIINNSGITTNTQLGGFITKNPHLSRGGEARLILNEVTSNNRSRLEGFTEIAGRSAPLILANPNGITCNGCGFINTPKATLTTARPTVNNGVLTGLSVNQGDVLVEGLGLNANGIDAVEIMARAINVNAQINAKDLQLIAGRNDITPTSSGLTPAINVTAKADDGSVKPNFAIDSSSLGGMYANRIHLLATENGVGVNIAGDLAANVHEMTITANGQLVFKKKATDLGASTQKISAAGDIILTSQTAGIEIDSGTYKSVHANNVSLISQGDISNTSQISSAQTLNVTAQQSIINTGKLQAGVSDDGAGNITKTGQGQLILNAGQNITNGNAAVLASDNISLTAANTVSNNGTIQADTNLSLQALSFNNQAGFVKALNNITASLTTLQNNAAISSNNDITLNVTNINNTGVLTANNDLSITGSELTNDGGTVGAGHETNVTLTSDLNNINSALLFSNGAMNLYADNTSNIDSTIFSAGPLRIAKNSSLALASSITNSSGNIESLGNISLYANNVTNKKREFEQVTDELSSGYINYTCLDCGGDHYHLYYHVNEQLATRVTKDSPASLLLAGGNLNIESNAVHNLYNLRSV